MMEDEDFDELYDIYDDADDDFETPLDEVCPNCHIEYDEIDYEYQICHHCRFDNRLKGGNQ